MKEKKCPHNFSPRILLRYTMSLSATRGCPCVDTAVLSVANVVTSDLISNAIGHNSVIVKDMDIRRDPSVTTGGCLPIRLICSNKRDPTTVETLREFEKKMSMDFQK